VCGAGGRNTLRHPASCSRGLRCPAIPARAPAALGQAGPRPPGSTDSHLRLWAGHGVPCPACGCPTLQLRLIPARQRLPTKARCCPHSGRLCPLPSPSRHPRRCRQWKLRPGCAPQWTVPGRAARNGPTSWTLGLPDRARRAARRRSQAGLHASMITPGLRFAGRAPHLSMMFMITEADADAIRAAFFEEGELSAAIELRRRFPGITDNAQARTCARTIAGWKPPQQTSPANVTPLRPSKRC